MLIKSLRLQNFKRFEDETYQFQTQFTVMIGENATGKTSILEGLSIFAGAFLLGFGNATKRHIKQSEVRKKLLTVGEVDTLEPQYPTIVSGSALLPSALSVLHSSDQVLSWSRELSGTKNKTTRVNAKNIADVGKRSAKLAQEGQDIHLPLLAYYGTGRLWDKKSEGQLSKPDSRDIGYRDCLDPQSNHALFEKWFSRLEIAGLQKKKEYGVVEAVRSTVKQCIPGCKHFYFDIALGELVVELENQGTICFSDLSDGYRNMLAIVADITHRAARLNPQFGKDVAKEIYGVVLIDEIDLHLHPKWQRRVVDDLKSAFPKLQFIATTHSPFIIQSMQTGEVIDLSSVPDTQHKNLSGSLKSAAIKGSQSLHLPRAPYVNRSIEDIVEGVMGVTLPSRSLRLQKMFDAATQYYQLLETAKELPEHATAEKEQLKVKLDALVAPFSDDVAYHAFLKMERLAAGLSLDEENDEGEK